MAIESNWLSLNTLFWIADLAKTVGSPVNELAENVGIGINEDGEIEALVFDESEFSKAVTRIDISRLKSLRILHCHHTATSDLDCSQCPGLEDVMTPSGYPPNIFVETGLPPDFEMIYCNYDATRHVKRGHPDFEWDIEG
jgi:hypothetical protein